MDDENDDQLYIDPEILKKELVISLPVLTESDVEILLNGNGSSGEELSYEEEEEEKEKPCLKRDQRRLALLNNPDYGAVLCFIDKFRSYINMKKYPLRILEDNLVSEQEKPSLRFIDFHLALLKKVTSGKVTKREQFTSSITNFAYRFNRTDGEYLDEHGYSKSKIDIKIRILKNLLEKQFDCEPALKNLAAHKPATEMRSKPFGRDRFGASYWLFTDTECFLRLFRENTDVDRKWTNLAKNQAELENVIKILIADRAVREKFPNWKIFDKSFSSLSPSNEFEERYAINLFEKKNKNDDTDSSSLSSSVVFHSNLIKIENVDIHPNVNIDRNLPLSSPESSTAAENMATTKESEIASDNESINSVEINAHRSSVSSNRSADDMYSLDLTFDESRDACNNKNEDTENSIVVPPQLQKSITTISKDDNPNAKAILLNTTLEKGQKRKLVDYDDSESGEDSGNSEKIDETSQDSQEIPINKTSTVHAELPLALRRSRRGHRTLNSEGSSVSSNNSRSLTQNARKGRSAFERRKVSWHSSKSKNRSRRNRRRGKPSMNGSSSSTSDEHQLLYGDDDDDDFSDDFLSQKDEFDALLAGDLPIEEDDDDGGDETSRRRARTVAQYQQELPTALTACTICTLNNRPDALLLCEDCDDAYHLDCLRPTLFSIPCDNWYCPLCEHKRLCDGLIEKLHILIKDQEDFEMKRRLNVSKRRKRLTNVAVNVDRFVKQTTNDRSSTVSSSTDEEEKTKINEKPKPHNADEDKKKDIEHDDDDKDSVYGHKNDENQKPSGQDETTTGKRQMRSCRRKEQNYSYNDFDKKIKDAIIDAGVNKELIENDSDDSNEAAKRKKTSKKRSRLNPDEDSNFSDTKDADEFVPRRRRTTNDDSRSVRKGSEASTGKKYGGFFISESQTMNDDSRSDARDFDDNDDFGMSDDDRAWLNRRASSTSSIAKKKSDKSANRTNRRKSTFRSEEDSFLSDATVAYTPPPVNIKSEPITDFDRTEINTNVLSNSQTMNNAPEIIHVSNPSTEKSSNANNSSDKPPATGKGTRKKKEADKTPKPRRQRRPPAPKKKSLVQQENQTDDDNVPASPPQKRRYTRKQPDSNESPENDDDDYDRLAKKRRLYSQGKATRTSITTHIKKLVGDEDDDEEQNSGDEQKGEKKTDNSSPKKTKKPQHDEYELSDDDDFPDEEEILKTTGLSDLKQAAALRQKTVPSRPTFISAMPTMSFMMADPTANFDLTCMPDTTNAEPSDSTQA